MYIALKYLVCKHKLFIIHLHNCQERTHVKKCTDITQNKYDVLGKYKLNCSDSNKFYVGQSGGSFKQRYDERIKALHTNQSPPLQTT